MSDKSKFSIKRKNLTAIKEAKEAKTAKEAKLDTIPEEQEEAKEDTATATKAAKGGRYVKRKPLTKVEHAFLKDFYYKGDGAYAGRDVLYNAMKAHYTKHKTPKGQQISRRRMWEGFLKLQESNQVHRLAPKKSEVIRPINAVYKLSKGQCDLIIRGGDSARTYKGILCVVDVSTRRSWTEVLKGDDATTARNVAKAMTRILDRVFDELPEQDKKTKLEQEKKGKSKTFVMMGADGGSEFKGEFASMLKERNINQVTGIAHRSSSQSIVEKFNGSLQASMAKESTATGAEWHTLVSKHTSLYNNRTHRLLRLKESDDPKAEYKIYTPNELYKGDRATLRQLHDNKANKLGKQNKDVGVIQDRVKVGDTVRLVDLAKRKGELQKGYKANYTKELYVIYKIHKPKGKNANRPYKYYVEDRETGKKRMIKDRPIVYTIRDFMVVDPDVQEAPDDIKIDQTPEKAETRSSKAPSTPPPKPKPAPKPPKKQDEMIGKKVKSVDAKGKVTGKGTIIRILKKGKGGKKYEVEWDAKYNFSNGKYSKKDIDQMLL